MQYMKAAVYERYGPPQVVRVRDVPRPVPQDDEVLVRIFATTLSSGDRRVRSLDMPTGYGLLARAAFGLTRPRRQILGSELSGQIERVGSRVTRFRVGQQVIALCGVGMGCHAEYRCINERGNIVPKPENLRHEHAAALSFGGTTALRFLMRASIVAGERVLVNGASGCVGSAAIQLAKHFGCVVTGVCSARNTDIVRALGAHHVVDYTTTDFSKGADTFDVVFDAVGNAPYSRVGRILTKRGRLISIAADLANTVMAPAISSFATKRVIVGSAGERIEDLRAVTALASKGVFAPLIDRRYALPEMVEAHRYADSMRKRGSIVITFDPGLRGTTRPPISAR